jgi:hypothetical protein
MFGMRSRERGSVPEELQGDYDQYFEPMTDEDISANLEKKLCHDMSGSDSDRIGKDHDHGVRPGSISQNGGDKNEPQEPPEVAP